MQPARLALAMAVLISGAAAQDQPAAPTPPACAETPATREAHHRLGLIATSAIAYFHVADSIQENLEAEGLSLHPEIVSLRLRLEAALDDTDSALERCDAAAAGKAMDRAQGLLDRFRMKLGG